MQPDFKKIKVIISDFDGVWTDNKVYTFTDGNEAVCCSKYDSIRLPELKKMGIKLIVLTTEKNPSVANRLKKLGIKYYICSDGNSKFIRMSDLTFNKNEWEETCFIGNDVNDKSCYTLAGIRVCPPEAPDNIKKVCNYITKKSGGDGCIREILDLVLD